MALNSRGGSGSLKASGSGQIAFVFFQPVLFNTGVNLGIFLRKAACALLPQSCWLRRKTKNGAIVSGLNRPGFGGRGFFIFGEALEPELVNLHLFLRPGDVFMDVGANAGVFSMKAARCVQEEGLVIAIEPLPDMFCTIQRNVRLNGFNNFRLRNFCASDRNGIAEFWINFGKPNSASLLQRDPTASRVTPLCLTLDEFMRLEGVQRVDYLKIDAEGAEPQILKGATDLIARFKPVIQVEVTLSDARELAGYEEWKHPGSVNSILLPHGHRLRKTCQQLGYQQGQESQSLSIDPHHGSDI